MPEEKAVTVFFVAGEMVLEKVPPGWMGVPRLPLKLGAFAGRIDTDESVGNSVTGPGYRHAYISKFSQKKDGAPCLSFEFGVRHEDKNGDIIYNCTFTRRDQGGFWHGEFTFDGSHGNKGGGKIFCLVTEYPKI